MLGVAQRAVADAEGHALEVVAGLDEPLVGARSRRRTPPRSGRRSPARAAAGRRRRRRRRGAAPRPARPGARRPARPSPARARRGGSRAAVRRARRRGCAPRRAASGGSWSRPWAQCRKHSCARTAHGTGSLDVTRATRQVQARPSPSPRRARANCSAREHVDQVVAHGLHVARARRRRAACQPFSVIVQFTPRASSTQGSRSTSPCVLHAPDGVRQPAARVREVVGELGHPQRAVGRLGEPDEHLVLVRDRPVSRSSSCSSASNSRAEPSRNARQWVCCSAVSHSHVVGARAVSVVTASASVRRVIGVARACRECSTTFN